MNINVVKTLTIRNKAEGAQETTAALKGVQTAYENVAKVSETSARGQLSLADAVAKAERRFNSQLRAQQDFERVQRQMNAAVAQNPALQERVNKVLADARVHYDRLSVANDNYASRGRIALQAVQAEAQGLASRFGVLGSTVAAMGPGWLVFGASLGVVTIGLHQAATAALQLAERAGKLKDFAETTGFTVIELQALEKAGEHVGVSSESVTKALERFSVQMAEVKLRTGETYEKLLAIDPTLARQASTATSLAKAYELVSTAIKNTDLERANQLARAFFGRGGVEQTRLMRVVADAGGLKGVIAELHQADIITAKQAERWDTLGDTIASNMRLAKQNIASIFTENVLVGMDRFSTGFLNLTRSVKEFGINEDFKAFIAFFTNKTAMGAIAGALGGARVAGLPGAIAGGIGGAIGGSILQNDDAKNAEETARQLDILSDARDRTIEKLQHYQKLAAAPDNHWAKRDAEEAEKLTRILERTEKQMKVLGGLTVPPLPPAIEVGVNKVADAQEALRTETIKSFNEMGRWMSVIGSAATLTERYELSIGKLNAEKARGLLETGKAGQAEELYARKLAELKQQVELHLGVADMSVVTTQRVAQVRELAAKAGLTDEQTRLALGLAQREAKERELQAWARLNPEMAAVRTASLEFASGLAKDLAQGVDLMDALTTAAGRLGETLIDIGTKKLVSMAVDQAASMFGAGSDPGQAGITGGAAIATGGLTAANAMIAGATTAAAILSGSGAATGVAVAAGGTEGGAALAVGGTVAGTAINGPLVLLMAALVAIGAALSSWSGASAKAKQEEEAQARAWEQWQAAGLQLASYFAKANGTSVGNIRTQLQEQQSEAERFIKLRSESQGFKSAAQENADPIIRRIREAFGNYSRRIVQEFEANFRPTIEAMKSGFGEDSPFFQSLQEMKGLGEKLQSFIADTETVFGKGSNQSNEARLVSQQFALSTLQRPTPQTEIEADLQALYGRAKGLQSVLEGLGMSSIEAARNIEEGVKQAIDSLKVSFGADLERQLNDLGGKGYFNDIFDALAKNKENLKNNELLGGGKEGVIQQILGMSAQGIVDQFKLTGAAFQELLAKFPELSGVVKEFVELVEVVRRSGEDITKARQSIQDELFGVITDTSTTDGQLAALEREFQRRRAEEVLAGGELSVDLEALYLARRGRIIEDANQRELDEARRLAEEQARIAESLKQRVQSFQDMTFNALNDTSTLEGQLAALAREERRAREQEAIDGNGALAELNEAFFARELAIRKSFGDRAIEEAKRVAEAERQAKNQAAKTVLEYLAGLQSGSNATVSPQENFANSLAFYTSNLAFAQGNPADPVTIEAVNKFPQVADNLEKAARALYGSGTAYQDIRNQIISQGLNLPTVQQADDPLVVALRDTVTAVQVLSGTTVTTNTGLVVLTTNTGTVSSRLVSLGTDLTSISGDLGTLATDLTGVSTRAGTLANDLGGPGGVSQRMVALSADLGGTGGVSQRLLDLASTVGTGNDTALRATMIALAGEVADAGTEASGLAADADNAAAKARDLARDAADAALKATNLSRDVADAALKAIALATAIGTSDNNGVLRSLKLFGDNLSDIATQLLLHFNELDIDRSGAISRAEFTTSLGDTADVNSLFTSLDINADNNLTQMELMVAQQREANKLLAGIDRLIATLNRYIGEDGNNLKSLVVGVNSEVHASAIRVASSAADWGQKVYDRIGNVSAEIANWGQLNFNNITGTREAVADVRASIGLDTTNTLQSLNSTATEHLRLMKDQLTNISPTVESNIGSAQNNMLTALNKIVINTAATVYNTGRFAGPSGTSVFDWANRAQPVLATGGWIGGSLHSQGGTNINAELGEHVTNRISAGYNRSLLDAINAARGPLDLTSLSGMNDNFRIAPNIVPLPVSATRGGDGNFAAMLAEIRELRRENAEANKRLDRIESAINRGTRTTAAVGEQLSDDINENTGEAREQTREMKNAGSGKWAA